jgi:hypothetical protein
MRNVDGVDLFSLILKRPSNGLLEEDSVARQP